MRRASSFLLALLAFGGFSSLARAQQPESSIPPEFLAESEEARNFFASVEAEPVSGDISARMPAELRAGMDGVLRRLLLPGEREDNRRQTGVDLEQVAASRSGGVANNMLYAVGPSGAQHTYYYDADISSLLPPGARLVATQGAPVAGPGINVDIAQVSPKVVMVIRSRYRREGRLRCLEAHSTRLFSLPDPNATLVDMMAVMSTLMVMERLATSGFCFGAEEREPGTYIYRSFDIEGRRLPNLNESQPPMRIVPVAPFAVAAGQR